MVLLPDGLKALKRVVKEVGLDLRGAYVNLDGGFDSRANRKCIFNAGMIPNIKENPRILKAWMAALKSRLRPRLVRLRLRGFSLMLGIRPALKMHLRFALESNPPSRLT